LHVPLLTGWGSMDGLRRSLAEERSALARMVPNGTSFDAARFLLKIEASRYISP